MYKNSTYSAECGETWQNADTKSRRKVEKLGGVYTFLSSEQTGWITHYSIPLAGMQEKKYLLQQVLF